MLNKRFLGFILVLVLAFTLVVNADTTMVKDLDKSSSYAKDAIAYLVEQGVIKGDQNGNFNPKASITRTEMVTLLARVFELDTTKVVDNATFKDVPKENWANPYVEAAFKAGVVNGSSPTTFRPNDKITREQMAVMFIRALKLVDKDTNIELKNLKDFSDAAKVSTWAKNEVEIAMEAQLMNGVSSNTFEPGSFANREQAAVVIERLMKNKDNIISAFKTSTADENSVKLVVNGEPAILKNAPLVKDGSLYLPAEYIDRYMTSSNYNSLPGGDSEVMFALSKAYQKKDINYIWFQKDNKTAYLNLEPYPFESPYPNMDHAMELKQAPVSLNGTLYLPLEDLKQIFGMDFSYSEASNTLSISDSNIGKSSNLYSALKTLAYTDYIGEIRAKGTTEYTDNSNNYHSIDNFDMRDRMIDVYTGEYYTRYTYQENNDKPEIVDDHVITTRNGRFTQDYSDMKWIQESRDPYASYIAVSLYNILFKDSQITQRNMNRLIFDNIEKMDVKNAGSANISGMNAAKYVIEIDLDSLKNLMTDEDYANLRPTLENNLRGDFRFINEYYVFNNKVIKQNYTFNGEFKDYDNGEPYDIHSFTEMYYNKLPRDFKVIEPIGSQLKPVAN